MDSLYSISSRLVIAVLTFLFTAIPHVYAQSGHVMNGVGPTDQSMSGAGMAAPQDALTALHWNPASLTRLDGRILDVSLQLMMPTGAISSSVQAGAFGPDMGPEADLYGSTESSAGPFPIPSVGYAYAHPDSRLAYGFSVFGVGGFGVDYEGATLQNMNPILTPQMANGGMGFGALSSSFMLMQISPTVAWRLTDHVSVGLAPTLNLAQLELSVFPATAPILIDPQNPMSGLYPDAPAAWAKGLGFQAGVHVTPSESFEIGLSWKSPQWFEEFTFAPESVPGAEEYTFRLDYPMIVSGAVAWKGFDRLLLAADIRYIDFSSAEGFNVSGFDDRAAVRGFGWESVTVFALGAQYDLTPRLPIRAGWAFNESPVGHDVAFFNAPAPAIVKHHLSGGFGYQFSESVGVSVAAQYGFRNECDGVWKSPMFSDGENPYTSVRHELSTFTLVAGIGLAF